MNIIFPWQFSVLLCCTGFAVVGNGLSAQAQITATGNTAPIPGKTATSTAALTPEENFSALRSPSPEGEKTAPRVAQIDINPGQVTRGGLNYIGVGGYIGTDTGFSVISKIGLTTDLSVRPSAVIENDATFRIPITYEFFPIPPGENFTDSLRLTPYIGGGIVFTSEDSADIGAMVATGLDFPLGPRFTGNANVNVDFRDDIDVGVTVGFGYNFAGF